ncbi:hypothetical protein HNR06_002723 [Nocardiopsis arvandica]|uniref:Uncharacterized protein n=1 Tax=Nocardiopsis sinuspersici TaxID=501010 RepID=A0A7Z0BL75_9ACTN|nr:hypothetical protein [Nocardiopsis sinuspersici]
MLAVPPGSAQSISRDLPARSRGVVRAPAERGAREHV